jgi:hypothetical protein
MTPDPLLDRLAELWDEHDPAPPGLVARMQRHARAEADLVATDWDHELMLLVERTEELVGARSGAATYTLRFSHGDLDLLLRIAVDDRAGGASRIDGWVVPPLPMTVRALGADGAELTGPVDLGDAGRFELTGVPAGLTRVRLEPHDTERTPIVTPTFEI